MKRMILTFMILLLMTMPALAAHSSGSVIEYELINGKQYKVIHHLIDTDRGDSRVVIYYFQPGEVPQGKYKFAGVEIYEEGRVIEDTFRENDL